MVRNGEILLTLRGKEPSRGLWGIPGGVVEAGETLAEAVRREVLEETGLVVEPRELITVFNSIIRDEAGAVRFHYVLFEYLCRYVSGVVEAGDDAPEARWVALDELDSSPSWRLLVGLFRERLARDISIQMVKHFAMIFPFGKFG